MLMYTINKILKAGWQSGHAAACKAVYAGSIPASASSNPNENKYVIFGIGYVGLSNAVMLSINHSVTIIDIDEEKIKKVNQRVCPIEDKLITDYFKNKKLDLEATNDLECLNDADYVLIAVPTDLKEEERSLDTSIIEEIIDQINLVNKDISIVIKSTIPLGFVDKLRERNINNVFYSPEFLRETSALYDCLNPDRVIIGSKSYEAISYAETIFQESNVQKNSILHVDPPEAELIKLASNTFLAMRVAFFNEIDNFSIKSGVNSKDIITGISLDARIGNFYNNPSFGYGGYCLPKDSSELKNTFKNVPSKIIDAIVDSNIDRKIFISDIINKKNFNKIGIYKLNAKHGSNAIRNSAMIDLLTFFKELDIHNIEIFEPLISSNSFMGYDINNSLIDFKNGSRYYNNK